MSSSNLVRIGYKKESVYGVTPSAVKAFKVLGDITVSAINGGLEGNEYSIESLDTVAQGSETVVITGKKITINLDSGNSTATEVLAAFTAATAALSTLGVSYVISGTAGNAQTATAVSFFTGGSGGFKTARFTGEQYSGTPDTTESQQIRTDRMSSGQIVTGLTVEGGHNFELAKEEAIEDFLESAMFNQWSISLIKNGTFAIDLEDLDGPTLSRSSGSFIDDGVVQGDFLSLSNFAVAGNNTVIMVVGVTALEIIFAYPPGMITAVAEAASYQVCDKLTIGIDKQSLTIEKTFLDLTTKALVYRGCLVSQMDLTVEYGSLITGSFKTSGNDYESADASSEFASYLEYFSDPATTSTLNGSVDMPFVATNVTDVWEQDAFCLQNLNLSLNNNLTEQNCIGRAAPQDYSPGTAQITADLSSYLKDSNWGMLARKLSQQPFSIGFMVGNLDGYYGFYIPALQVSFDDPQSGGANQEISMEMKGTCKVGANGESALTIFRAPTLA